MILSDKLMPTPFETAARKNNKNLVHDLISGARPLPIDIRNEASQTGLMISCAYNSVETVKEILAKYQELENHTIDDTDTLGWTALHHAAKSGSCESLKFLLEHKAGIDATTDKNETALFLATKQNHLDIVEFLAEKNCQLQIKALYKKPVKYSWEPQKEEYLTSLEVAVQHNFIEITKCLLFHLIRRNQLNELLLKAANEDHTKIANDLLINGANVNYHGEGSISYNIFKVFFWFATFGYFILLLFNLTASFIACIHPI
jgi:ankyrin repeat protein